ncbi:MAG: hypothetical protein ABI451_10355 [Dokdonella sp.]
MNLPSEKNDDSAVPDQRQRNRRRFGLIAVFLLFFLPVVGSYVLFLNGWRPGHLRNYGELVSPAQALSDLTLNYADGTRFDWKDPDHERWTLLGLTGPDCATQCLAKLDELRRVRLSLAQKIDKLRVVVVDATLTPAQMDSLQPLLLVRDSDLHLSALRPSQPDQVSAALVDPEGYLALRYAAGYDGNGLRKDISRLLR